MKPSFLAVLAAASLLGACATVDATIPLTSQYSIYEHQVRPGSNKISGNALLRTVGGDVKTCAGYPVVLMPDTQYSRERMRHIYGNIDRGYGGTRTTFSPPNSHYENEAGQRATCDSQGNFEFNDLADGSYFIISLVSWDVPGHNGYWATSNPQGGTLMQRVTLSRGQTARVVLTQ